MYHGSSLQELRDVVKKIIQNTGIETLGVLQISVREKIKAMEDSLCPVKAVL